MSITYYSEIVADQPFAAMLDGLSYRWFYFGTIPPSGTKEFLFYIPDTDLTTLFYGRALEGTGADGALEVFSDPTFSDPGTPSDNRIFNLNSNATSRVRLLEVYQDPVLISEGTVSDYDQIYGTTSTSSGNKGSLGSSTSQEFPRILKKDSWILSRITNFSTTVDLQIAYKVFWAEIPE